MPQPLRHLGIDLGGTKVVLALGDEAGEPIASRRRATSQSGDWRRDLDTLIEESHALLAEASVEASALGRIGVSVPGPADPARGIVINPPNLLGWENVPVAQVLADALGAETRIENDANAAALAEAKFGAGRGVQDLVYLTMSTGIGAGILADGRLIQGAFGAAGEMGHMPIAGPGPFAEAPICACGLRGCFEAYVGGNAWRDHLRRTAPADGRVVERAGGDVASIRPEHLVEAAREGDAWARAEFDRWLDRLVDGLVPVVMTFDPQRIVLGTIAVAAGEALCFTPLRVKLGERLWSHQLDRLEIVPAELGAAMPERAGLAVALAGSESH